MNMSLVDIGRDNQQGGKKCCAVESQGQYETFIILEQKFLWDTAPATGTLVMCETWQACHYGRVHA